MDEGGGGGSGVHLQDEAFSRSALYLVVVVVSVSLVTFLCTILGNICGQRLSNQPSPSPCSHFSCPRAPRCAAASPRCGNCLCRDDRCGCRSGPREAEGSRLTDSGTFRRLGIGSGNSGLQPLAQQLENGNLSPMPNTPPDAAAAAATNEGTFLDVTGVKSAKVPRLAELNRHFPPERSADSSNRLDPGGSYLSSHLEPIRDPSRGSSALCHNINSVLQEVEGEKPASSGTSKTDQRRTYESSPVVLPAIDDDDGGEGSDEDEAAAVLTPLLSSEGTRKSPFDRRLGDPGRTAPQSTFRRPSESRRTLELARTSPPAKDPASEGGGGGRNRVFAFPAQSGNGSFTGNVLQGTASDHAHHRNVCATCGQEVNPETLKRSAEKDERFAVEALVHRPAAAFELPKYGDSASEARPRRSPFLPFAPTPYRKVCSAAKVSSPPPFGRQVVNVPAPSASSPSKPGSLPSSMWDHEGMDYY